MNSTPQATILVVDDTPQNLALMRGLLRPHFKTLFATDGRQALNLVAENPHIDLILLDVMMPDMDGYDVCRQLKAAPATAEIPVIFLTARTQSEDEREGLELGAADYVAKPINPPVLLARTRNQLVVKQARDVLRRQNELLESRVAERTRELVEMQDATIFAMSALAEKRDNETGNHILRTQHYVRALAVALREQPEYAADLDDATVEILFKAAPLHDIGKVGVQDSVLLKPGPLTPEEWALMREHPAHGRDAILAAERMISGSNAMLRCARDIAYCHHEKWDGSGYPQGLQGSEIPLSARLMAVADVYDALITRRVYKPAFSHDKAVSIIREGRERHFDPAIVDAFGQVEAEVQAIARRFDDASESD